MEMDFMARPEQLRNSIIFICICFVFTSCYFKVDEQPETTYKIVQVNDESLKQYGDRLFYADTLFTGKIYALYENTDSAFVFIYKKGKQTGFQQKWYANGQIAEVRLYEHGRKEGIHYGWWENGKRKFEYHFANDEHQGELKEWFENGMRSRLFHYEAGHEKGNQRMWWPDGSVRANYDIKNGKRYGLIGEKLCTNTMRYAKN
jgi:antitoxin component YwqK of YwqJK toxin-antitoxin module